MTGMRCAILFSHYEQYHIQLNSQRFCEKVFKSPFVGDADSGNSDKRPCQGHKRQVVFAQEGLKNMNVYKIIYQRFCPSRHGNNLELNYFSILRRLTPLEIYAQ